MIGAFNEAFLAALEEGWTPARDATAQASTVAAIHDLDSPMYEKSQFAHPLLFSQAEFVELSQACRALLSAQLKLINHLIDTHSREGLLDLLRMPRHLARFIHWDNLRHGDATIGRMDIVPTRQGYFFCEFNIFPGVGGGEAYEGSRAATEALGFPRAGLMDSPLRDLAVLYAEECRKRRLRRVVILDSRGHSGLGYPRQEYLKRYLEDLNAGVSVHILDEVSYPEAWLKREEAERTLIHRMFTYEEVTDGFAFLEKLWASGAVLTNGFEPELRMSKRFLALLCEPGHQALFSDDEEAAIRKYLPPAFSLSENNLAAALRDKAGLVFKIDDSSSYGGSGVLMGTDWSSEELERKLREPGVERWICQRVVEAETVRLRAGGDSAPEEYRLVLGFYSYGGRTNGFLVRGSRTSKVVNITSGGKLGWAFVVSEEGRQAFIRHARGRAEDVTSRSA
ncbi:hypothetical protein HMI49_00505 [Corallococcus exercitus]|uniref:Circularly permuted type 2 ATP-grasp protein n=1 Tax=Corallococcus exercitus TaxID=2316736 RepID=A0A7Y4KDI5_9BACT|nr:hypothetical protein [Corallococcus exercitus]NOK31681.1 hypothetical protein [Corallococcus exercitus]